MIYLDHAATNYPLSDAVRRRTVSLLFQPLGNPGRSGHPLSLAAAEVVYDARVAIASLLGLGDEERVIFTSGATAALNLAIRGTVLSLSAEKPQPFVITDVFEHNSVLRPLFALAREGVIRLAVLSPDENGGLVLPDEAPDLAVLTARSNVTGREFSPSLFHRLKHRGTFLILDAAQRIGHAPCDFASTQADLICAPGHKGLGGIMGGGFLAVSDKARLLMQPILFGGSGNDSFNPQMPSLLPERFEAGTLPLPAIAAMAEGAKECLSIGLDAIEEHERACKRAVMEKLGHEKCFLLYDKDVPSGPISLNLADTEPSSLAERLSRRGIYTRAGFHCAPLAHRWLGSDRFGSLRLSFGKSTSIAQAKKAAETLCLLARDPML